MSLGFPYACCPAVGGSVLIVVVRECIVDSGSVSAPRPLLGVGDPSILCCCIDAEYPNLPSVCRVQVLLLGCAESRKNS